MRGPLDRYRRWLAAQPSLTFGAPLPPCPTLIIASAKPDELTRQQAAATQIPYSRFEKIEDAAHAVFLDQPDRFDGLLRSIVSKLTANHG